MQKKKYYNLILLLNYPLLNVNERSLIRSYKLGVTVQSRYTNNFQFLHTFKTYLYLCERIQSICSKFISASLN